MDSDNNQSLNSNNTPEQPEQTTPDVEMSEPIVTPEEAESVAENIEVRINNSSNTSTEAPEETLASGSEPEQLEPDEPILDALDEIENQPETTNLPPLSTEPQKKSKKKLIITIIAILLFVGLVGVLYLLFRPKDPNAVVTKSIEKLSKQSAIVTEGNISYEGGSDVNFNPFIFKKLDAKITSQASIPGSSKIDLNITTANDQDFSVSLEGVMDAEGVIYLKTNEIRSLISAVADQLDFDSKKLEAYKPYSELIASSADLNELLQNLPQVSSTVDPDTAFYGSIFYELDQIFTDFDNKWWKISSPEITDLIAKEFDQDQKTIDQNKKSYACTISAFKKLTTSGPEFFEKYKENPFLTAVEYTESAVKPTAGGRLYQTTLDPAKAGKVINALSFNQEFASCMGNKELKISTFTISEGEYNSEKMPPVIFEIDPIHSEFKRIIFSEEDPAGTSVVDLKLAPSSSDAAIPAETESFIDFAKTTILPKARGYLRLFGLSK